MALPTHGCWERKEEKAILSLYAHRGVENFGLAGWCWLSCSWFCAISWRRAIFHVCGLLTLWRYCSETPSTLLCPCCSIVSRKGHWGYLGEEVGWVRDLGVFGMAWFRRWAWSCLRSSTALFLALPWWPRWSSSCLFLVTMVWPRYSAVRQWRSDHAIVVLHSFVSKILGDREKPVQLSETWVYWLEANQVIFVSASLSRPKSRCFLPPHSCSWEYLAKLFCRAAHCSIQTGS